MSEQRLYQSVAKQIRDAIDCGEFPVGARLPGERELAERFNVSRVTIREAEIALEALGWISIRTGSSDAWMSWRSGAIGANGSRIPERSPRRRARCARGQAPRPNDAREPPPQPAARMTSWGSSSRRLPGGRGPTWIPRSRPS